MVGGRGNVSSNTNSTGWNMTTWRGKKGIKSSQKCVSLCVSSCVQVFQSCSSRIILQEKNHLSKNRDHSKKSSFKSINPSFFKNRFQNLIGDCKVVDWVLFGQNKTFKDSSGDIFFWHFIEKKTTTFFYLQLWVSCWPSCQICNKNKIRLH